MTTQNKSNREYKRKPRRVRPTPAYLMEHHLCGRCAIRPRLPGSKKCQWCIDKAKVANQKYFARVKAEAGAVAAPPLAERAISPMAMVARTLPVPFKEWVPCMTWPAKYRWEQRQMKEGPTNAR